MNNKTDIDLMTETIKNLLLEKIADKVAEPAIMELRKKQFELNEHRGELLMRAYNEKCGW